MKKSPNNSGNNNKVVKNGTANGFLPYSIKFISSCIKTVSSNVKSAGASVAGSISGDSSSTDHHKDQVICACFDRLELGPSLVKRVLLIGYSNGFQVLDVEDASNVCELVSRHDDPVSFLQMQPIPAKADGCEGFRKSHPILLVVASDDTADSSSAQNGRDGLSRDGFFESYAGNLVNSPTTVRFYSLRSHNYVHILRFRSTVYMVRCSPQIVAVGLAAQIYCFDALTLENKFSVLTYPVPQVGGQGLTGVNIGCGPMAVGTRWLAYASNNVLVSKTGRLSPQSLSPSPGVSPSTSPSSGNLVARYAMESSKQLAAGLINLGDRGYKTFSRYCNELLPDGPSSPVPSNGSWKVGRLPGHTVETDAAGMVVLKDFISRAIVSQFRAHTSPISALSFDPSGTLLVTASIHGNNINIFRIMSSQNGLGTPSYDSSTSHVHLYKLHRGVTSAVIQDICFSHYSQWIAIVSSRATCHIFVLSPFGGEAGLQLVNSHADGTILLPVLSVPWWSTSSFLTNQQSSPQPPVTMTLSVVSRIRKENSGWLNTVSNAASSAAGKVSLPSGVVAAVFHNSLRHNVQSTSLTACALEHLLVYSPSGHLIQYELLPSLGGEQGESSLRNGSGPLVQMQEDDLRVRVEPIQWWDVCRRADWPEREECINGITLGKRDARVSVVGTSSCYDNDAEEKNMKPLDRSHWYLSNAEVQLMSGRIPIWQKSKIYFYAMSLQCYEEAQGLSEDLIGGEIEIEKIPACEIEIRHKDLLPVFDHFHGIHPAWGDDRKIFDNRFAAPSIFSSSSKEKSEDSTASTRSMSTGLAETLRAGSSLPPASLQEFDRKRILSPSPCIDLTADENDGLRRSNSFSDSPPLNQGTFARISTLTSPEPSGNILSYVEDSYVGDSPISLKSACLVAVPDKTQVQLAEGVVTDGVSNSHSDQSDTSKKFIDNGQVDEDMNSPVGFGQYFQEGYCKASNSGEPHEFTETVADIECSSSPHDKEKSEEDGESDDLLGGVFAFSEEG